MLVEGNISGREGQRKVMLAEDNISGSEGQRKGMHAEDFEYAPRPLRKMHYRGCLAENITFVKIPHVTEAPRNILTGAELPELA